MRRGGGTSGDHHGAPTFSIYERDSRRFFGINLNPPGLEPSTQLIDGPLEVRADVALGSAAQIEGSVVGEQCQLDACRRLRYVIDVRGVQKGRERGVLRNSRSYGSSGRVRIFMSEHEVSVC
ncbi:hypothetical protein EVAR_12936_1 [Eumeta japonica]|uniref:Uncharacterized protein n=1 Tax=Eumeta variegata TaxID=151549 RepID=A0A4C1TVT4_EUMVA|nr:hypothetical protein EVAR_12936_1 [Eumeta japonica]